MDAAEAERRRLDRLDEIQVEREKHMSGAAQCLLVWCEIGRRTLYCLKSDGGSACVMTTGNSMEKPMFEVFLPGPKHRGMWKMGSGIWDLRSVTPHVSSEFGGM